MTIIRFKGRKQPSWKEHSMGSFGNGSSTEEVLRYCSLRGDVGSVERFLRFLRSSLRGRSEYGLLEVAHVASIFRSGILPERI